jgi:hypothetical protein
MALPSIVTKRPLWKQQRHTRDIITSHGPKRILVNPQIMKPRPMPLMLRPRPMLPTIAQQKKLIPKKALNLKEMFDQLSSRNTNYQMILGSIDWHSEEWINILKEEWDSYLARLDEGEKKPKTLEDADAIFDAFMEEVEQDQPWVDYYGGKAIEAKVYFTKNYKHLDDLVKGLPDDYMQLDQFHDGSQGKLFNLNEKNDTFSLTKDWETLRNWDHQGFGDEAEFEINNNQVKSDEAKLMLELDKRGIPHIFLSNGVNYEHSIIVPKKFLHLVKDLKK